MANPTPEEVQAALDTQGTRKTTNIDKYRLTANASGSANMAVLYYVVSVNTDHGKAGWITTVTGLSTASAAQAIISGLPDLAP